jgi:anti-anti-sigma regulatory factor
MSAVQVIRQPGETRLIFDPTLGVADARDLYSELNGVLADPAPVVLDAGQVERVDAAAIQVLVAFVRAARAAGLKPRWHAVSDAVREAASLLGLDDLKESA